MLERDVHIGAVSACLSVRLTRAGTDSKLMTIGSCSFHHLVARDANFLLPTFIPWMSGKPPFEGFRGDWVGRNGEKAQIFD